MTFTLRLTLCAVPMFLAASAFAQDVPCAADGDCGPDQICALSDCPPPCDPADPTCQPVDCGTGGVCIDIGGGPADCISDADCAVGEACITETFESCTGNGCACPDGDPACGCDQAPPPECTTETISVCLPPYAAPCVEAADCGDGFTCEFFESCACSGSSGGGAADPAAPEPCDCLPADEGSCVLTRVECVSAADCLPGFECVAEATTDPCLVNADGTTECGGGSESVSICAPPGFVGGGVERETGALAADDNDAAPPAADEDDGFTFSCQASGTTGLLPLAALGMLLRRRRST